MLPRQTVFKKLAMRPIDANKNAIMVNRLVRSVSSIMLEATKERTALLLGVSYRSPLGLSLSHFIGHRYGSLLPKHYLIIRALSTSLI